MSHDGHISDAEDEGQPSKRGKRSHSGMDALLLEEGYTERLAKIVTQIKRAAQGRVCGGCKHIRDGWCAQKVNVTGDALTVLYPNAVACGQFEAR